MFVVFAAGYVVLKSEGQRILGMVLLQSVILLNSENFSRITNDNSHGSRMDEFLDEFVWSNFLLCQILFVSELTNSSPLCFPFFCCCFLCFCSRWICPRSLRRTQETSRPVVLACWYRVIPNSPAAVETRGVIGCPPIVFFLFASHFIFSWAMKDRHRVVMADYLCAW